MKNKSIPYGLVFLSIALLFVWSCADDVERPVFPLSAEIFHSVDGKQVAFTALTHSATSWQWDFGDGNTSTEKDPVYVYEEGGYYIATLTATDNAGNTETSQVKLALELTPYSLLTGDHTAEGYQGKTWKLTAAHPPEDKLANANLEFTYATDVEELPTGAFDLYLGIGEIYDDEFTFYYDGSYGHDVKEDGATFAGLLYASVLAQAGGTTITKTTGELIAGADIFAITTYSPEAGATFVFNEKEDLTIPALPDFANGMHPAGFPILTYSDVMTIDFPNSTEFIGVMDFQRKVLVQEITENTMRLAMFMTLDPAAVVSWDPLVPLSTTALVLTFEVVK
ncbi:PKD domain-containing protein [Draconibacterium sp.]|nr:PKD domain-containing protein [Draconibacterium sp.]